jgi:putative membrane protein insertion efficiency factor
MLSARKIILWLIRAYQIAISPLLGAHCRFYPSCSAYTHTAVERFGVMQGAFLGLRRLCRCHPLCPGGYDPVPDEKLLHG